MEILYILVPISVILITLAITLFGWAIKNGQYDDLEANSSGLISLLKERRTALISAAVTGKIDVRNWQTPKPSSTNNKEDAA